MDDGEDEIALHQVDVQKNDLDYMKTANPIKIHKGALEELYRKYNRREFISPDPLQFLWDYSDLRDREIVGLISSSLAYGRVAQILKSVSAVLQRMEKPFPFVAHSSFEKMKKAFHGFKHRFTTGEEIAGMLYNARRAIERHGSLEDCFAAGIGRANGAMLPAISEFVKELRLNGRDYADYLLPCPSRGSACKRLNLFLRWMVRKDDVDPGVWKKIPASMLIIPLDTHMDNICRSLGITKRRQANMKTAVEITEYFKEINPDDPVKYDFALTRLGIVQRNELGAFLEKWRV